MKAGSGTEEVARIDLEMDLRRRVDENPLYIGDAARAMGTTPKKLGHWCDVGYISFTKDQFGDRRFNYAALELGHWIAKGLDHGWTLKEAAEKARDFQKRQAKEQQRAEELSAEDLRSETVGRAEAVRRALAALSKADTRLGREMKRQQSMSGFQKLIAFIEANPFVVNTGRQIAFRVGRDPLEVQRELDLLVERRFIQKISYPGCDVYRYIPPRR